MNATGVGPLLTTLGAGFASFPLALLIGNGLVWLVLPARRSLDREASTVPGTDFITSQRKLIRVSIIIVPLALVLAVIGALLPW